MEFYVPDLVSLGNWPSMAGKGFREGNWALQHLNKGQFQWWLSIKIICSTFFSLQCESNVKKIQ